jgi:antitoxin MazE
MIKTLTKHGNSLALVIDKSILELLQIDDTTPLEITTDGELLIVSRARDETRKEKFHAALDSTKKRYGNTLKKLGE